MLPYDFSEPIIFLIITGLMFLAVVGRYFLIAGIFHLIFYAWFPEKFQQRKIHQKIYPKPQFIREIGWSMLTAFIFAVIGAVMALVWQEGYTAIYLQIGQWGWFYFVISIAVSMFIHETYYYWLHRWMHQPKIYQLIHKVHHESQATSPWTAFSFHPAEGFLEALILPAIIMVLPMQPYAIVTHLTIMTLTAAINHLDIEIYPKNFYKNPVGKWLIGATHHSQHHRFYRFNYGLYFTCWDKWAKTESPTFESEFEIRTEK
ncbi:MAG: sterol desaturase family protein [Verrucomicrobia bacterium]|nr:sterol desaturase family protein [Cytophagales bacterium]